MGKLTYEEQAINLCEAVDIAVRAFQEYPPKGFDKSNVDHVISTYLDWKNGIINAEPKFQNLKSLKHDIQNVFTFFQETGGKTVDYFWDEIKKNELPFHRENKMSKILKRGKIKNDVEYNFIVDVMVPYEQEGLLSNEEVATLNQLLKNFEQK